MKYLLPLLFTLSPLLLYAQDNPGKTTDKPLPVVPAISPQDTLKKGTYVFSFQDFMNLPSLNRNEIVMTALGVERNKRTLGYSLQEIKGEELIFAKESNFVSLLAGRAAGVNVVTGASGIGSSARITIRGESSLDVNLNKNQPLFLLDGIPINDEYYFGTDFGQYVDGGNGAAEINPYDVESVTILKGPNAAALYGSRAANGVVLITTKSGKNTKGLGVSLNSSVTFETPIRLPDYQDQYGQGRNGQYDYVDGKGGGINDGSADDSWGPPLDKGLLIRQFDSPVNAQGVRIATPWVSRPDNVKNFFGTGHTLTNNVALAGGNQQGDFRFSYTQMNQQGFVPNTDLNRYTVALRGSYRLSNRLTVTASMNYLLSKSDNRPNLDDGSENIMSTFAVMGRQIDLERLKDYWQPGREGLQQFNYQYPQNIFSSSGGRNNPHFMLHENTNGFTRNRLIGLVSVEYKLTDWLRLKLRSGGDGFDELRQRKRAFSQIERPYGQYGEYGISFYELNTDFLLTLDKRIGEHVHLSASAGGNRMSQATTTSDVVAEALRTPGIFTFSNARDNRIATVEYRENRAINSLYATGTLGFRNYLFLDITARNDWSSTLPSAHNSFFYPGAALGLLLSELLKLPQSHAVSFAKIRAGIARVGNYTEPYRLDKTYSHQGDWGNTPMYGQAEDAYGDLKPEITTDYEAGADIRFFNNRLGVDLTIYRKETHNEVFAIPALASSGQTNRYVNGGRIRNQGIEVVINAIPVKLNNGFRWDINLNFARNKNRILALAPGIEEYEFVEQWGTHIVARVGGSMGDMYGNGFQRAPDGSIIHKDGKPLRTLTESNYLGNYNPDWIAGLYNRFYFKGIYAGFMLDLRVGGEMTSRTLRRMGRAGTSPETLEGRDGGIIGKGVIRNSDGSFRPNDVRISSMDYFRAKYDANIEAVTFDASYLKLRELIIGYSLPAKWLKRLPFKSADMAIVGRNLSILWSPMRQLDPETMSLEGTRLVPGIEIMGMPSARSIGFHLSLRL